MDIAGHCCAEENTGVTGTGCADGLCLRDKTPAKEKWEHLQIPHIWAQAQTLKRGEWSESALLLL